VRPRRSREAPIVVVQAGLRFLVAHADRPGRGPVVLKLLGLPVILNVAHGIRIVIAEA